MGETVKNNNGNTIVIPGSWAISFPLATTTSVDPDRLYLTA